MNHPTPLTPADSCVRAEGSRREGYFFLGFVSTRATCSFPATSAAMSCLSRFVIEILGFAPYRHHRSNASRSDTGRTRLIRTFGSCGLSLRAMHRSLIAVGRDPLGGVSGTVDITLAHG